jgi:hypothetical protein
MSRAPWWHRDGRQRPDRDRQRDHRYRRPAHRGRLADRQQVGLGNVNGVAARVPGRRPGAEATATKDGNTYTIKGTATGVDMASPMQPMTKPFEIAVTCP